jgi:hypothetical protein
MDHQLGGATGPEPRQKVIVLADTKGIGMAVDMKAAPRVVFQPERVLAQQCLILFVQAVLVEAEMKSQAVRTFRGHTSRKGGSGQKLRVIQYKYSHGEFLKYAGYFLLPRAFLALV